MSVAGWMRSTWHCSSPGAVHLESQQPVSPSPAFKTVKSSFFRAFTVANGIIEARHPILQAVPPFWTTCFTACATRATACSSRRPTTPHSTTTCRQGLGVGAAVCLHRVGCRLLAELRRACAPHRQTAARMLRRQHWGGACPLVLGLLGRRRCRRSGASSKQPKMLPARPPTLTLDSAPRTCRPSAACTRCPSS